MTFLNKLKKRALIGKIFARWHLVIAITSLFTTCMIDTDDKKCKQGANRELKM